MGGTRDLLHSLFASAEEVAAHEERTQSAKDTSAVLIESAQNRSHGTFAGVVRSVVFNPDLERIRLEAELYDGSGALALVWLGRRSIAGVVPGSRMSVTGLVTLVNGRPVMYNPKYELKAKTGEAE